ncbi:MAG: beta-ketoacyl synthase N-terminal-like domain-containing protein, partial [Pseudomonadota bacterium]
MSADLAARLEKLDGHQLARLVEGLQGRIDDLRAATPVARPLIAITGLACRFPGAPDEKAFADLLAKGGNAIGPPPAGRPEAEGLPAGGYIEGIDRFDAAFFGIRDAEAAAMDPQQRHALEVTWQALEDAGAADPASRPRRTGIFLGMATHDYEARFHGTSGFTPQATTGTAPSAAVGRIAHLLDITGPALAIDTACSASLVAVHAACRALQNGECDLAIAGGVNAIITDALTRGFAEAGMLSPTAACRTFDAGADGYVRGEGVGILILKRLPDALKAGERIRAVIKGIAIGHDGRASSLTAPNAGAQDAVIEAALTDAGVSPADVQVVECHGTGTPLGDPIEVQALAKTYGKGRKDPLLLGAVKTNIGHLEAAAGVAGLIKLVLALQSGELPPTIHQVSRNPRIDWDGLPVDVVDAPRPWPEANKRLAAVSSFGFSGTNAHAILEAAPDEGGDVAGSIIPQVVVLSAPDEGGLSRLAGAAATAVSERAGWEGIAAGLAVGRPVFAHRAGVVGADNRGLSQALGEVAAGRAPMGGAIGHVADEPPRVAFLFTGQGSQWAGMASDLLATDTKVRETFER